MSQWAMSIVILASAVSLSASATAAVEPKVVGAADALEVGAFKVAALEADDVEADDAETDVLEADDVETDSAETEPQPRPLAPLRPRVTCPTDVDTITGMLLRDIPSYTNRVLQRTVAVLPWTETDELRLEAGMFVRRPYRPSSVLIAGQANLTPLDLNNYTYTTSPDAGGPLSQVFFTTLSRQYSGLRIEEVQEYHWLFLTPTADGWWLAFMFSAIDDPETTPSPLPPRESSRSSVGQAVQIWLKDCRAGAVELLADPSVFPD
ncbi:MAG: hypothetical protein WBG63_13440 [Phormidesmis sp.]